MYVGRKRKFRRRAALKSAIPMQKGPSRFYGHYKRVRARKNWTSMKRKYKSWKGNKLRAQYRNRQIRAATPYLHKKLPKSVVNHIFKFL
jgi:hypothetical protein